MAKTVTLETAASAFERGPSIHGNNAMDAKCAALIRSAQKVVAAAKTCCSEKGAKLSWLDLEIALEDHAEVTRWLIP